MYFKIYITESADESIDPKYSAELIHNGKVVSASQSFDNKRDAVMDAANHADWYEIVEDNFNELLEAIYDAGASHVAEQFEETGEQE